MGYPVDNSGGAASQQITPEQQAVLDAALMDTFITQMQMQQSMVMAGIQKTFAKMREQLQE